MLPIIKIFLSDENKKTLIVKYSHPKWNNLRGSLKPYSNAIILCFCNLLPPSELKNSLLRNLLNMKIGKKTVIGHLDLDIIFPELFYVGDNATIDHNVGVLTDEITQDQFCLGRIIIEKGAIIGAFSNIRSEITIGEGAVISMNSIVNKDVPPYELWGGVPAKRIRKLKK